MDTTTYLKELLFICKIIDGAGEIMSYDLAVHLNGLYLNDSFVPEWLAEIKKFNIVIEIHPEFSFSNHSCFLPFKFVIYDCPNSKFNNMELMSGFELFIASYKRIEEKKSIISKFLNKQKEPSSIGRKLKDSNTEIKFFISAQDSFEYRLGWYCAASLAKLCNGILTDLQEGTQFEGQQAIKHAYQQVIGFETIIKKEEWRIHEFKSWVG